MQDMRPTLVILSNYHAGPVKTKIMLPDGSWKIEIFASEEHAKAFADINNMGVHDARDHGEFGQ